MADIKEKKTTDKPSQRKRPTQFRLVNAYDEIVRTSVREVMNNTDMCRCERCYLDACAIIFNSGYVRFVNTREGELLSKIPDMNTGNRVEMMVQVMHALKLVRDFPHHGQDEIVHDKRPPITKMED